MNACQRISVFDTNNAHATKYRLHDYVMVDPHYPISVKTLYVYISPNLLCAATTMHNFLNKHAHNNNNILGACPLEGFHCIQTILTTTSTTVAS